jgi:hypothetical protein
MATSDGLIRVTIRGDGEVLRALDKLPRDATSELRRGLGLVAGRFTQLVRAAAAADSKPARRAATTVHTRVVGTGVTVEAGPHPLLFLSEFGMNKHTGWYGKPRYRRSKEPNAPHRHPGGGSSFWFFETDDHHRAEIDAKAAEIADAVVHNWSA